MHLTNLENRKLYLILEYLSDIELYFSTLINFDKSIITLSGDEFYHSVKVMRNKEDQKIYITDGKGLIYACKIIKLFKDHLDAEIIKINKYENHLNNFTFCLPLLKNPDRFKFTLEKCTEFGITRFIIFNSNRSVAKIKNTDKWNKTLLSAMKQSLRAFLPDISVQNDFKELFNLNCEKIIFDQNSNKKFDRDVLKKNSYLLIFGPEGGFTNEELAYSKNVYQLAQNRLRTETAVIKCAALIS